MTSFRQLRIEKQAILAMIELDISKTPFIAFIDLS